MLPWKTIVVATADLRFGAEAVARYLDGDRAGFPVHHRGVRRPERPQPEAQRNATAAGGAL
jgi:hypothetical protein